MSGTMTVKELIVELLDFDMGLPVYVGLGPDRRPHGSSGLLNVAEIDSGALEYGVYLVPIKTLIDEDAK